MEAMVAFRQLSVPLALHDLLEAHHTIWGTTGAVLGAMINIMSEDEHCILPEKLCTKENGKHD